MFQPESRIVFNSISLSRMPLMMLLLVNLAYATPPSESRDSKAIEKSPGLIRESQETTDSRHAAAAKTSPRYVIQSPDILLIEGIRLVPKSPYEIKSNDVLQINAIGTTPDRPIAGQFLVEPSGKVNLGPGYGSHKVAGLSVDAAVEALKEWLERQLNQVEVAVTVFQISSQQIVSGEHLVAPDGTVNLGIYGAVHVAGKTVADARSAIEDHLREFFETPQVSVDVFVYNSTYYYVIRKQNDETEVFRFPLTGKETVLDAVAAIGGFSSNSDPTMWITRPGTKTTRSTVHHIDWNAILDGTSDTANAQLGLGDRLVIRSATIADIDFLLEKAETR